MTVENFLKEAKSVFDDIDNLKKEKLALAEQNNLLKQKIAENQALTEKFVRKLKELSIDKSQFDALNQENALLKSKLKEKLEQVGVLSAKIDDLTRVLVKGDKFIHDLKVSHDSKQNEVDFLTKKLRFLASDQTARLTDFKKNLLEDEKTISFLKAKVGELKGLEKVKEEKNIETQMKEDEIGRISRLLNEFKSKAESLEALNKKLMRDNQELEFRLREAEKIGKKVEVIGVKKNFVEKEFDKEIEERLRNPVQVSKKLGGFSVSDLETNEIKAMVKTGLAHGDSLERIKNSLLSSGYKKEKIENALSFYNDAL